MTWTDDLNQALQKQWSQPESFMVLALALIVIGYFLWKPKRLPGGGADA